MLNHNMKLEQLFSLSPSSQSSTNSQHHHHQPNTSTSSSTCSSTTGGSSTSVQHQNPTGPMSHQQHHPNMQSQQQQHQFPQQMMQHPPPHPSMMGPMGVPFPLLGGLPPQMGLPPPPGLGPGAVLPPPAMFPHHPFGGMGAVLPPPPPPQQQPRMPVSPQHHIPFPVAQMMAGPRLPPMVPPQMQNLSASSTGSMLPNNQQHHQQQPQDQSSQGFSFSQTTQQQHIQLIQSLIHNTRVNYVQQHQQQQMQLMQAVAAAAASANASPVRMNPQSQNNQQQQQEVAGTRTSPNTGQIINGSHNTSFANGLQNDSQSNGLSTNNSASNSATNSQMLHSLMQQQQKAQLAQHQQQQQKLYQQMVLQQAQESARVQALREQSRRALMESTLPARGTIASSILESVLESESKKEQELVEEFRQHKQKQQQQSQLQQNQNQSRQLPSEVEVGSLIPNSNATVEALFKSVAIKQEIEDDDDSNGASNAAKVEALFKSFLPGFVPLPATPPRAPTSSVQSQQKQHHSHILPRSTLSPPPPSAEAELLEEIDLKQLAIPQDVMDDLASRFVLNMPGEEKDDPIRICFQIEIAFWFYVDFFCETFANLPKMKLKRFAYIMFTYIPRLRRFLDVFDQVITNWIDYKFSIPCSGAVLLDKSLEYVLLVQGYGSRNWSFPKGKVNHDETLMNCAIREVLEETGYDCTDNIFESTYLERKIFESACRLFIVTDVEMDYHFRPHVRNEIRNIQWFLVSELPMKVQKKANGAVNGNGNSKAVNGNGNGNGGQAQQANIASKFFTVYPFVYSIRKWIERERKKRRRDARLERRNRKRTISNGNGTNSEAELSAINGGASSSGAISSDDHDVSCSNSPYTVVECPSANESTSFVDVKLDDILGTSPSATPPTSAGGSILDKSLHGLSVFNADRGDEPEVDSRAELDLDDVDDHIKRHQGGIGGGGGDWPSTWQSLVNEYNRRNPIHTPIGYDLMSADGGGGAVGSIVAPSPTPSGAFKLEDIEKHHVTTTPPTTSSIDGSLGALFGASSSSANGGDQLSCDDKLNFLFSFATKQQEVVTTNSGTSSTTASGGGGDISKLLNDISNSINNSNSSNSSSNQSGQMIYSSTINKKSPFGAIGSKSGATSGTATSGMNTSGSSVKSKTPEPPKLPSINNAANTTNQPSTNQNGSAALSALFSFTSVTTTSTTTSGSVAVPVATPQGGGGISPNVSSFFASAQQHLNNNGSTTTDQSTKSSTPTPPPIIVGSVTSNGSSSISTATPKILEADEEDEEEVNFASASEDSSQEEKRKKQQQQQQQNSYNGFDAKNVPVIEDKIRKLIDRLRFLHN